MGRHRPYKPRTYAAGQRLLLLRTRSGLTQEQLAGLTGVHRRSIQNWETGAAYPQADGLQRLIAVYVGRAVFTGGEEEAEAEALWQQIQADAPRPLAPFDAAWFASVREQRAASIEVGGAAPGKRTSADTELRPTEPPRLRLPLGHEPLEHNLPGSLTPFVGRAAEIDAIMGMLENPGCRLVSLVGAGGAGKTRLALEVAWEVVAGRREAPRADGVFFVPLADMAPPADADTTGADTLATAIAVAMRFSLAGAERPYHQVLNYLGTQRALLVLDNVEHLLDLAPTMVGLLQQAPGVIMLVTSRVRLDVRGEQIVPLDGLPYPPNAEQAHPSLSYAALQLFQHTASRHAPRLHWTPENLAAAAEVCARVEGLPLAIELAAGLVRILSVGEIAAQLGAGSSGLQATQRDLPLRHRSMHAVFEHSWRLLGPQEQRVLGGLSVFRGGFDRQAAHAVAGADLPAIGLLVDHSLLREAGSSRSTTRYSMHELVRQYAADTAQSSDAEGHAAVYERHSSYYLAWAAARFADLRGERQQAAQAELHREIDNLRAAWRWAAAHGATQALAAAGKSLFHIYEMRSWFQEGADLFQLASASCARQEAPAHNASLALDWAQLLARQGWLTFHLGQQDTARALLARSLALLEGLDAPGERVFTLNYLAAVSYHSGNYAEARGLAHDALEISLRAEDPHGMAIAQTILGQIAYLVGAYDEARRWSLESLALEQGLGNRWGSVFTLISLGRVAVAQEAYRDARRWFEEGLAIRSAMGDGRGIGLCLSYLGDVAAAMGERAEAERQYRAGLAHFRRIRNGAGAAATLTKLGAIALASQDRQGAQELFHEALGIAWPMRALPQALDALAGLAALQIEGEPERAAEVASLVALHPAATESSKRQAVQVQQQLPLHEPAVQPADVQARLASLMTQLLAAPSA
jgi:predicted ATPase/transcriptional regulator with XRE-family HTH domain